MSIFAHAGYWPNSATRGSKIGHLTPPAGFDPPLPEFAADSTLEGDGFEPSVPGAKEPVFVAESECGGSNPKRQAHRTRRWREMDSNHRSPARKSRFSLRKANCGTEGGQPKRVVSYAVPMVSNPSPSSGESLANLTFGAASHRRAAFFRDRPGTRRRAECEPDLAPWHLGADGAPGPVHRRRARP